MASSRNVPGFCYKITCLYHGFSSGLWIFDAQDRTYNKNTKCKGCIFQNQLGILNSMLLYMRKPIAFQRLSVTTPTVARLSIKMFLLQHVIKFVSHVHVQCINITKLERILSNILKIKISLWNKSFIKALIKIFSNMTNQLCHVYIRDAALLMLKDYGDQCSTTVPLLKNDL